MPPYYHGNTTMHEFSTSRLCAAFWVYTVGMADRGTHEIITPVGKHVVVLYDWASGGDKRKFLAASEDEQKDVMIKSLIVSIDGKDNVLAQLDEMHGKDFDFVLMEIGRISLDSSLTAEKKTN